MALTEPEWLSRDCSSTPERGSQSLTVLSCDADARCLPSAEKAMALTEFEWLSSVAAVFPAASHPGSDFDFP